jgi:hypothetical protein
MLNMWKYDYLCEKLTFNGYLCEICSKCKNMTICVKMWLLLDICVKYAQCLKIWPFDVLVLFLKCVQFLKSCVQFLIDIIPNLAIVQFLMKKKGDMPTKTRVSYVRRRETRPWNTRLLSEEKGDEPTKCASRILGTCVSFLLNMHKKEYLQIILYGMPLAPTHSMPIGTHTWTYVCQWSSCVPSVRSTTWSTSCLTSSRPWDHHGFKSWWALILVGEIGLIF